MYKSTGCLYGKAQGDFVFKYVLYVAVKKIIVHV